MTPLKLLGWFCFTAFMIGLATYWVMWMEGYFEPSRDITPEPVYEVQTIPAVQIQAQEAASSSKLKLSTSTEEKARNAPLIPVE